MLFTPTEKFREQNQYKVRQKIDKAELQSLFRLLSLVGLYKSGRQNVKDL